MLVLLKAGSGKVLARGLRWWQELVHKWIKRYFNYTEKLDNEMRCKRQQ